MFSALQTLEHFCCPKSKLEDLFAVVPLLVDAMSDLKRKRAEMEEEIARISKELKKLGRQRKRVEKVHIPAGRRAAALAMEPLDERDLHGKASAQKGTKRNRVFSLSAPGM